MTWCSKWSAFRCSKWAPNPLFTTFWWIIQATFSSCCCCCCFYCRPDIVVEIGHSYSPASSPLPGSGNIYIYTHTMYHIISHHISVHIYIYTHIFHHLPGIYAFYANIQLLYIHSIWFIQNNPIISTKIVEDTYIPIIIRLLYIPIVFPSYPIKLKSRFFPFGRGNGLFPQKSKDQWQRSEPRDNAIKVPRDSFFLIIKNDGIVQWGYSNSILNCHVYISFENQT